MVRQPRADFTQQQSGQGSAIFDTTPNNQAAQAIAGIGDGVQQHGLMKKKQEIEAGVSNVYTFIEEEGQNVLDSINDLTEDQIESLRFDEDDSNPILEKYLNAIDTKVGESDFDGAVTTRVERQKAIAKSSIRGAIHKRRNQFEIAAVDRKITDLKNKGIDASEEELQLIFEEVDATYDNLTGPLVDESAAPAMKQRFRDDVYAFKADEALLDPARGFDEARTLAENIQEPAMREQLIKRIDTQERTWNQADAALSYREEIFEAQMHDGIDLAGIDAALERDKASLGEHYFVMKGLLRSVDQTRQASAEQLDLIRIERQVNHMLRKDQIENAADYIEDMIPPGMDQERMLLKVDNARTEPIDYGAVADQITEMEGLRAGIRSGQFSSVQSFAAVISDKVKTGALNDKQAFAMMEEYTKISALRQTAIQNNRDILQGAAGNLSQADVDQAFSQYLESIQEQHGPVDPVRVQAHYATAAPRIPSQIRSLVDGSIYAEASPANMRGVKQASGILNIMQQTAEGSHKAYDAFGGRSLSMLNRFYLESDGVEDPAQQEEMWRKIQLAEHQKAPELQAVIDATKQREDVQAALENFQEQSYFLDEYELRGLNNFGFLQTLPPPTPEMKAVMEIEADRGMQIYDGNYLQAQRGAARSLFSYYRFGASGVTGKTQWIRNAPEYHAMNVYPDKKLNAPEASELYNGFIQSKIDDMLRDVIDTSSGQPTVIQVPFVTDEESNIERIGRGMNPLGTMGLPDSREAMMRHLELKPVPGTRADYQVLYQGTQLFTDLTVDEIRDKQLPYFTLQWEDFEEYALEIKERNEQEALERDTQDQNEREFTALQLQSERDGITRETGL